MILSYKEFSIWDFYLSYHFSSNGCSNYWPWLRHIWHRTFHVTFPFVSYLLVRFNAMSYCNTYRQVPGACSLYALVLHLHECRVLLPNLYHVVSFLFSSVAFWMPTSNYLLLPRKVVLNYLLSWLDSWKLSKVQIHGLEIEIKKVHLTFSKLHLRRRS